MTNKRALGWLILLVVAVTLAGCLGSDPCSYDKSSPSCAARQAEVQATMQALTIQQEQSQREANIVATSQSIRVQAEATLQAVNVSATKTVVDAVATKTALDTRAQVETAEVQSAVAMPREIIQSVIYIVALISVVAAVLYYGKRGLAGAARGLAQATYSRTSRFEYGPPNDRRVALVLFDPVTNHPAQLCLPEHSIGFNNTLDADPMAWLQQLPDVPPELKVALLAEFVKRNQSARIAAATGTPPWGGGRYVEVAAPEPVQALPAGAPVNPGYDITIVPNSVPPIPQWIDEVNNRLLLEARRD